MTEVYDVTTLPKNRFNKKVLVGVALGVAAAAAAIQIRSKLNGSTEDVEVNPSA